MRARRLYFANFAAGIERDLQRCVWISSDAVQEISCYKVYYFYIEQYDSIHYSHLKALHM